MKKRILTLALALLVLVGLLSGCGSKSSNARSDYADEAYIEGGYAYEAPAAAYYDSDVMYAAEEAAYGGMDYWSDGSAAGAPAPMPETVSASQETGAKLIYTADMDMETMEFDEAVANLARLTAACGGYYESSSVSESGSSRRASYTVRVPAQYYRTFVDQAGELCHLLSQHENTEDVSEVYYDTAGRLETQKTKLARLQALLAQADNMEDIILLEEAISETEETIDRLSGTLRHYDALVDYSTVEIYLREVKVYEPEPDPTYGSRLGTAFVEGLRGFGEGLGDILIALAYSWLWLLLIAAIVVGILYLTRKRRAAKKAERAERKAHRKIQIATRAEAPVVYSQPAAPAPQEPEEEPAPEEPGDSPEA